MNSEKTICLTAAIIACMSSATPAGTGGEVITVTTLEDVSDVASPQQVGDLPGPDGVVSFREAVAAANNMAGPQTIEFAIPQSEWWLLTDRAVLRLENGTFIISDDETTVDFTSQTDFTGDTNPIGWEVGIYGLQPNAWGVTAILVTGDNCLIKGLDRVMQRGYGVELDGDFNRVISCTIGGPLYAGVKVQGGPGDPATGNIVGGTAPGEGNVLSSGNAGVRIDGPTDGTIVIGNTLIGSSYQGVQVRGASCCPDSTPFNTRIGGPTPQERNWIADNGKFGEEGFPVGEQIQVQYAVNTLIEGNYIGTTEAGDARYPGAHGTSGVTVENSQNTLIRNNLISGIRREGTNHHAGSVFGIAIEVAGPNSGVDIKGNLIGTDATGQNPIPNRNGITFGWFQGYPSGGQVGGDKPGDANTIAFNDSIGVSVSNNVTGVTIARNSIHSNGLLGIDLLASTGGAGVTPNDPGDGDSGGNNLQNFPVIDTANMSGGGVRVTGSLNSTPNSTFNIEFFASGDCDSSGNGEGERSIGATIVMTDAAGDVAFDVTTKGSASAGEVITATATSATGDTSEFSACVAVDSTNVTGDLDGSGAVDVFDLFMLLDAWGACGGCVEDLDGSGAVDVFDLFILLDAWTT